MTTQAVVITPGTDPFARVRPLRPGVADAAQPAPYHRFTVRVPLRGESAPFLPLARGGGTFRCMSTLTNPGWASATCTPTTTTLAGPY